MDEQKQNSDIWWKFPVSIAGRTDLSCAAKIVFCCLLDAIGDNGHCWPGIREISRRCGAPRSTISDAVTELEKAHLIRVEHAEGNPAGKTNRYEIELRPHGGRPQYGRPYTGRSDVRIPDITRPSITDQHNPPLTPPCVQGGEIGDSHSGRSAKRQARQQAKFAAAAAHVNGRPDHAK